MRRGKEHRGDAHYDAQPPERRITSKMHAIEATWRRKFDQKYLEKLATRTGQRVSDFQKIQIQKQLGLTIEPKIAPRVAAFTAENVSLIKSMSSTYFSQVEQVMLRGVTEGTLAGDIASEMKDRFNVASSRAELIARDQVGKMYSAVNQARQEANGITSFIWRSSEDERVRPEHEDLDGEEFTWEDGAPVEGYPGQPVQCRCVAEPVITEF